MHTPLYRNPFVQVLFAIAAGILLGYLWPSIAVQMKPLGDIFIRTIKLLVAPVIFFTVASGLAAIGDIRRLGSVGIKAVVCFEALSLLALLAGLAGAHLLQPGAGFRIEHLDALARHAGAMPPSLQDTFVRAFTNSLVLQSLLAGLLCGVTLALLGMRGQRVARFCEHGGAWLLRLVGVIVKAAPLAAFGAIAFTVGKYGAASVEPLLRLLGALYLTMALFVAVMLGALARASGFSLLRFLVYIKEELLIVAGVASSVAAMPKLIEKLERAGCSKTVAGVVIPAGYSFNLNGTAIYLTLALMFLAQALRLELSLTQQLTILAVAMVTSKGASGVAGSAFIALAATLAAVPEIPDASLVFIVGIERLLKCRSLTNIIGNGVACIAISAWSGELDRGKLHALLQGKCD